MNQNECFVLTKWKHFTITKHVYKWRHKVFIYLFSSGPVIGVFFRKLSNMMEEIDVQRRRDEFLEFLEELTEQFEELQLMLLTDNLEIADRSLNIAKRCSSGILLFITVF